ncbi:AraC family transcriptional regulator [Leptospira barantonii]|uniref:AraC family transcriptional regulator n=1 Tax=Leptospira barantonii TaxID=2023184 RepID=A0A5F2AY99_9LEPT|nr:helix-turn-helix domain-containing protein [Leptospira barantonii]TGL93148.1 AraC family transcriptional regulator [Leptospira barantonii]
MNTLIQNFLVRLDVSKIRSNFEDRAFYKSKIQKLIERNLFSAFVLFFGLYLAIWNITVPEITGFGDLPKLKLLSLISASAVYSCLLLRLVVHTILGLPVSCRSILRNAALSIGISFAFLMYFEGSLQMVITGELLCFGICGFTALETGYLIRFRKLKKEYYYLLPILIGIEIAIVGDLLGITFYNSYWNSISYYTYILSIFVLYLIKRRMKIQNTTELVQLDQSSGTQVEPGLENQAVIETNESRFEEKNLLKEDDLKRAEERIEGFIREKLYADDSIRLIDLSAYLGISLHQASFYLNNHMNTGFSDFINRNRMNDAHRLLVEKQNMNLLDIAFECGFNSYTSFHRACKKWTGNSPKGLRKKALL